MAATQRERRMIRNPRIPGRRVAAHARRGLATIVVALGLVAAGLAPVANGADTELIGDTAAKAEFDYFTEDRRALERLATETRALRDSADPVDLYGYAHVQFRRLQLAAAAHAGREAERGRQRVPGGARQARRRAAARRRRARARQPPAPATSPSSAA